MRQAEADTGCATVQNIVFNETTNEERSPWTSPCGTTIPRSEVLFITQIVLIFTVTLFCIVKLSLTGVTCEESTVYFSLLASCLTYLIPPPQRQ
jgi:hypothetical protein